MLNVRHKAWPVSPGCRVGSTSLQVVTVNASSGIFMEPPWAAPGEGWMGAFALERCAGHVEADPLGLLHLDEEAAGADGLAGRKGVGDAVEAHHGKPAPFSARPGLADDLLAHRDGDARLRREAL